jgi:dienelactone hydrolase
VRWISRPSLVGALFVVAIVAAVQPLRAPLRGLALVVRAADVSGAARSATQLMSDEVVETSVLIPTEGEPLRARVYAPDAPRLAVLLVTGIRPAGIDEPRLIRLSRDLAKTRVTVVTPEIRELMDFRIAPVVTDRIAEAATWLLANPHLAGGGAIGLMGVSFSGGLAVVAAGRPSLRGRLDFVLSLGGHDDLARVLDFLCSRPADGARPPHDYGVAVALLNVTDRLVPDGQIDALRVAVRRFLDASYLARFDRTAAMREFEALSVEARALPEPSATLLAYLAARDVPRLASLLRPHLRAYAEHAALSPARSPLPSVPVYLLHGRDDDVIPSSESRFLADRLRGHAPVHLLVTGVISHADADQPAHALDVMRLARFWGRLLNERRTE